MTAAGKVYLLHNVGVHVAVVAGREGETVYLTVGVAEANVATKTVDITVTGEVTDKQLVSAVTEAGYTVKSLV